MSIALRTPVANRDTVVQDEIDRRSNEPKKSFPGQHVIRVCT
jgi:hypothetical protein